MSHRLPPSSPFAAHGNGDGAWLPRASTISNSGLPPACPYIHAPTPARTRTRDREAFLVSLLLLALSALALIAPHL